MFAAEVVEQIARVAAFRDYFSPTALEPHKTVVWSTSDFWKPKNLQTTDPAAPFFGTSSFLLLLQHPSSV